MHTEPKRRGLDSRRVSLTIALSLAVATVSAGLVLGHHPTAEGASSKAAAVSTAPMAPPGSVAGRSDPSVPAASDAVGGAAAETGEPASTF